MQLFAEDCLFFQDVQNYTLYLGSLCMCCDICATECGCGSSLRDAYHLHFIFYMNFNEINYD